MLTRWGSNSHDFFHKWFLMEHRSEISYRLSCWWVFKEWNEFNCWSVYAQTCTPYPSLALQVAKCQLEWLNRWSMGNYRRLKLTPRGCQACISRNKLHWMQWSYAGMLWPRAWPLRSSEVHWLWKVVLSTCMLVRTWEVCTLMFTSHSSQKWASCRTSSFSTFIAASFSHLPLRF